MENHFIFFASRLVLGLIILIVSSYEISFVMSVPEDRAFIVFGDSLVDNGNNDFLVTTARADSPPYGIDTPSHRPTGRFSNGLNIPDLISERLGKESTLPYLNPELKGDKLLIGANFASAGIGILNDTGIQFINIIHINRQIELFQQYQSRLKALIGAEKTQTLINKALVLISLGGNDFVNNYYLVPLSPRSRQMPIEDYVPFIISEYRKILLRIYELGARTVIVTGSGPMGCVPAELAMHSRNGECATALQHAAALYNPQLNDMLTGLNSDIGSHVFIAANTYQSHFDFITNPQAYGFATSTVACCGQGPHNGLGLCTPRSNLCPNRELYVFWDAFHPTEKASRLIVKQIFDGSAEYMTPVNLSTILAMDSRG